MAWSLPKRYCPGCCQIQMDIVIVIVIVIATAKRTFSSNVDIMWLPINVRQGGVLPKPTVLVW